MKAIFRYKGGSGSGNFGHRGRPGEVGGSQSGGIGDTAKIGGDVIRTYVQHVAKAFPDQRTKEGFVFKYGRAFNPTINTTKLYKRATSKQCYKNAYELASSHSELTYVEGYAVVAELNFPMEHAWVIDKNNNVIDNTWKTPGLEYFGIPMSIKFVSKVISETGTYGVLDFQSPTMRDAFENGFPKNVIIK